MPFMGRDWRSPGEAWIKTESLGWQRMKIIESQLPDLTSAQCHHPHHQVACSWPPSPRSQQKFSQQNGVTTDKCDGTSERSTSGHCNGGKSVAKRNHSVSPVQSQDSASDDQSRPSSSSSNLTSSESSPGCCCCCCCYPNSSKSRQSVAALMEPASTTNLQCQHSTNQHCNEPQLQKTAPHCRISVRTKEVAMHNTISEAFYRLDFYNAIHDIRRFNYICKLLHLLITQNLTSLSGCATRVLFTMLEQVAREVSANKRNINVIRNLLADIKQTIQKYSCWGRPIGSTLLWQQHFETIERISQIVDEIELSPPKGDNYKVTFDKLPVEMIREILLRLNDYRDLVNSAQASPVMRTMIDNQCVWQKLCRYHFTDQQLKLAFESNKFNLVKKQQQQKPRPVQLRGTKYARTTSADGRSSYRSPVVSLAGQQQSRSERIGASANRPAANSPVAASNTSDGAIAKQTSSSSSSSYVTNAVRIFDKERSSASSSCGASSSSSSPSSTLQDTTRAQQQQQSKANERCQPPPPSKQTSSTSSTAAATNDTALQALEIDWERVFHQLRKRFDLKEEYADCLFLCRHCRCLFWKSFGHPCVKNDESIRRGGSSARTSASSDACRHCHASYDSSCRKLADESGGNNHGDSFNRSNQRAADNSGVKVKDDEAQRAPGRRGSTLGQPGGPKITVAMLSRSFDRRALVGAHENVYNNENTLLASSSFNAAGEGEQSTTTTTKFSGSSHDASSRQPDNGNRPRQGDSAAFGSPSSRQPLGDLSAQLREHNFNRQQRQAATVTVAAGQPQHGPWQQWQQQMPRRDPRQGQSGAGDGARDRPPSVSSQRKELVPKHVTISPQAFLKFFSL